MANVSKTTNILEAAGFRGPVEGPVTGDVTGEVTGQVILPKSTVAELPSAADNTDALRSCSNGNAGAACLVYSDGTNWKVVALGATASAT